MSTHQEPVNVSTDMEPTQHISDDPIHHDEHAETQGGTVQEGNNGSDSLTLFLVAIGSAVLSTLFTLLILAVVNDGTLSFTGGDRLTQFQDYMEQVDGNVGVLSERVTQAEALKTELGALQAELENQNTTIGGMDEAILKIDETRQQFDGFVSALNVALSSISTPEEEAAEAATEENTEPVIVKAKSETSEAIDEPSESEEVVVEEAAVDETEAETPVSSEEEPTEAPAEDSPLPMIETSDQLPADAVAALILEDTNGNGVLDGGETSISGATISLSQQGNVVESKTTDDAGVTFMALAPGSYEITVDDAAGYALSNAATIQVDVADENGEGQFVYFTIQPGE